MVRVLILVANLAGGLPQGSAYSVESYVSRLRAWESRFSCVIVQYHRSGSNDQWSLCTAPTHESLLLNGKAIASYEAGTFYRTIHKDTGNLKGISYGSGGDRMVGTMVSDMRVVLFDLGVLFAGDEKMSHALESGQVTELDANSGRSIRFRPRSSSVGDLSVEINWNTPTDVPSSFSFTTKKWTRTRQLSGNRLAVWPLRVTEWGKTAGRARSPSRTIVVDLPVPATSNWASLKPKPGDAVMDEDFSISYTEGRSAALDEERVRLVLDSVRSGKPLKQKVDRQLLCGLDCLYYLSRFRGLDVSSARLESLLPEARRRGCSFAEMQNVAVTLGLRLDGYKMTVSELKKTGKLAILSFRNAHFALLVPSKGDKVIVIDPPYAVQVLDDQALSVLWTGAALVLE